MSSSYKAPKDSAQPSSSTSSSSVTSGKRGETSPVPAASKEPKSDDNAPNIEFIEKFLEFSVCLDFPSSPIHTCDNAHVLCGQCAPKLSDCPTCKLPKLRPNPLGEKLAKEANKKIDCDNLEAGSKEGVLSTKFLEHLPLCYYREITCDYNGACGLKVKFHDYTKHLKDIHNEKIRIGLKFTETYRYDVLLFVEQFAKPGKGWLRWEQSVVKFDSQDFIVHSQLSKQSQLYFSWVSVMGDEDLAKKYICDIKFKDRSASNETGCIWSRRAVLAFHEIPSNESEAKLIESSAVAAVPLAAIKQWAKLDQDGIRFGIALAYIIKNA